MAKAKDQPTTKTADVHTLVQQRQAAAETRYSELVVSLADGTTQADAATIEAASRAAGRTLTNLSDDVALVELRIKAAADITEAARLEIDLPALNAADQAARDAVIALEQRQRDEMTEARRVVAVASSRRDQLDYQVQELRDSATRTLSRTAHPDIVAELKNLAALIEAKRDDIRNSVFVGSTPNPDHGKARFDSDTKIYNQAVAEHSARLQAMRDEITNLEAQQAELRQKLVEWDRFQLSTPNH